MVEVIQYYNVRFYLLLKDERERRWFSFLEERIMAGEGYLRMVRQPWGAVLDEVLLQAGLPGHG